MDIFLADFSGGTNIAKKISDVLQGVSPLHQPFFSTGSPFFLWQDGTGESVYLDTDDFAIWFDGYVRGGGSQALPEYLRLAAARVVQKQAVLQGDETGVFNLLVLDKHTRNVYVANDPGGMFPVYYLQSENTFYVCSHLYLLAQALNARPDFLQLAFKELIGYALARHTYFEGIKRLLPGEVLAFDPENLSLSFSYPESFYISTQEFGSSAVDAAYEALSDAINCVPDSADSVGVMLSEGYDSRLLAGMFRRDGRRVVSFTHGSAGTKGQRITRDVGKVLGLEYHFGEAVFPFTPEEIRSQLLLSDNLHIPYWMTGSNFFKQQGVYAVTAGTALDSTLGGHIFYKPSQERAAAIWQRYSEIIRQDLSMISDADMETLSGALLDLFVNFDAKRLERRIRERFAPDIAEAIIVNLPQMKPCIQEEWERLSSSGSFNKTLLLQRFFLENRARKFSFGQELTLRIKNRVVVPSYERAFMKVVTRIPAREKLHHRLYFLLLAKYLPEAASVASGNYAFSATWPRVVLETSRFSSKITDLRLISNYLSSRGKSGYNQLRSALFQEKNGRSLNVREFFVQFFTANSKVLQGEFYEKYLDNVWDYKARAFNLDDFYRAVEFSQIVQHKF